uniref:Uncharacterized protein n=1 Tax=Panagrolaimus davidi TaxID=227884 RepID=A0A914PS99_9BILA
MELQHKKDLQNLEKQIQKLDKEKQLLQSEIQEYAKKEETLKEKCSTLENEIAEFKRLNGVANDEIMKLQEQLQEIEKESESKMKISKENEQSLKEKYSILENEKSESQKKFAEMTQKNEELIAEFQLKMDKLEADKQSLIEKISAVESLENEKFEELNQKYSALKIKDAETERSLTIANTEIIILKEKLNSAEMNEKLNALEDEKKKLKVKIFELETRAEYYENELHETRIRSNYNDFLLNEQQSYINSAKINYQNLHIEYELAKEIFFKSRQITDGGPNTNAESGPEMIVGENVEQGQNVATVPDDTMNNRVQNLEACNSFLVFENNQFKNSNSNLRTSNATLKTDNEKLQKRLFNIDEYLKKHRNNLLPSIEKYQSSVEQISKSFETLNAKFQDEKNSAISKSALLIQQNLQHSEEKKIWITIFNEFCVKMNLLKNENVKLFGELKYYREAFSSGNDEVVVPTKRKRKSMNPQQKHVQQPNIIEKLPDSNNNDFQFSAPENFASKNPGSSSQ